jgi:hypothetical protein
VHPKYKTKYRVSNWAEYDRALVQRGDITLWISEEAIEGWKPASSGTRPHHPISTQSATRCQSASRRERPTLPSHRRQHGTIDRRPVDLSDPHDGETTLRPPDESREQTGCFHIMSSSRAWNEAPFSFMWSVADSWLWQPEHTDAAGEILRSSPGSSRSAPVSIVVARPSSCAASAE